MLYVNADDLGWTNEITDRILTCYCQRRIHSASALTFMKDSERASDLAQQSGLPVGLHLNFTQDFTGQIVTSNLRDHHRSVAAYLNARKANQILYNPFIHRDFDYVFQAQWDEFCRLYGKEPARVDGHHHMHLCINMLACRKLPQGLKVRRNFTFAPGEKGPLNRLYRHLMDLWLTSRFQCTNFFFSLIPIDQRRHQRFVLLSRSSEVEIMVHPGVIKEYLYLLSPYWTSLISAAVAPHAEICAGGYKIPL